MLLCHCPCCRAPWLPVGGAGPNYATDTSLMACGWHPYPWIGRAGADGIDTKMLPSCCCPVGNIMVFEQWKLEVRYPTINGTYSYGTLRERKMRNCEWYIFIVSRTTTSQVDHDNKIAVVRGRSQELVMITLVRLQGHKIRATRNHELPEATLDPKGAQADHSAILA